jgi:hypothetical protein
MGSNFWDASYAFFLHSERWDKVIRNLLPLMQHLVENVSKSRMRSSCEFLAGVCKFVPTFANFWAVCFFKVIKYQPWKKVVAFEYWFCETFRLIQTSQETQGALGGFPRGKIENLCLQKTTTILSKRELCNIGSFATFPWSLKGIIEHKGSHKGNVHHNHHKGNYNCFFSLCSCSWYSFSWYVIQPQLSLTLPQWRSTIAPLSTTSTSVTLPHNAIELLCLNPLNVAHEV